MRMQKRSLLFERFKDACLSLNNATKVVIVHHADADGFCSAVIAAKAIKSISGTTPSPILPFNYGNTETENAIVESVAEAKPDIVFVIDINIDSRKEFIEKLEKATERLVIIDHHKIYADCNSEKTVFLKAQNFRKMDGVKYVNSKFAFDLFSKITDIGEMDWITCVGILGDKGYKYWKKFFEKTTKRTGLTANQMEKLSNLINAVSVVKKEDFKGLFEEFLSAKNPKELLKSNYFSTLDVFNSVIDKWVAKFNKEHSYSKKLELMHYTINPEYRIKSALIDRISEKHPKKTIIIFEEYEDRIGFSARRQDHKIKVNELLEKSVKGIPDSVAGGHAPAAAGSIPKKYYARFLENLEKDLAEVR